MKRLLSLLFGKVGLVICGALMAIISWFLIPVFVNIVQGSNTFYKVLGWIFICPFAVGFYISSITSAISLIAKNTRTKSIQWWWLVLGAAILIFDVVILILNLV